MTHPIYLMTMRPKQLNGSFVQESQNADAATLQGTLISIKNKSLSVRSQRGYRIIFLLSQFAFLGKQRAAELRSVRISTATGSAPPRRLGLSLVSPGVNVPAIGIGTFPASGSDVVWQFTDYFPSDRATGRPLARPGEDFANRLVAIVKIRTLQQGYHRYKLRFGRLPSGGTPLAGAPLPPHEPSPRWIGR